MEPMRVRFLLPVMLISLAFASAVRGQYTKEYNPWPVIAGDTLRLPFLGGINDPKPSLVDFDRDGLTDLMLGEAGGKIVYFRNVGTPSSPVWSPRSERLGGVDVGTWHTFVDIDGDGDLDLFGDARTGRTAYWQNLSTDSTVVFTLIDSVFGGFQTGINNTCDFADIDDDHDFDFFFGNLTGTLTLYRNIGDSVNPAFVLEDEFYDGIIAFPGGLAASGKGHGFSSLYFADIDTDGDEDLFYGDIFNFNLYHFVNLGTPDTSALTWLTQDYLATPTQGFNHATLADLDNDSDLDMLIGAANGQDIDNLLYLRNDGTLFTPDHVAVEQNYISNLDVGSFSVPAFGDLDGDGDWDMLIGAGDGRLWHFENTGTSVAPVFVRTSTFYKGIDVGSSASPELVDWDRDSDLDLLIGTELGKIEYWRNEGTVTNFDPVIITGQLGGILVDRLAVPRVADLNGDDLPDLLVGEWDFNGKANLRIYRNVGTANNPLLTLHNSSVLPVSFRDFTIPQIVDYDGDGRDDLLLGGRFFGLTWYRNVAPADSFPDSTTFLPQPDTIPGRDDGYRLATSWIDIDSDGDLDLFVGEENGGINFHRRDGGVSFLRGDVNVSGGITSADIIYLVNFVFKAGDDPLPVVEAGDVDCTGSISSSDIIFEVNFVFKAGPPPCLQ